MSAATAVEYFRTPNAGQITRTLKAAGFTQATRNGVDGFKTEAVTRSIGGTRAPLVYVRPTSGHPVKMIRDMFAPAAGVFDVERAVEVLRERHYAAEVTTDDKGRTVVAVWSMAARDARTALAERMANADALAAEWITDGMWKVETEEFPTCSRTLRTGDAASVRAVVAHVLRSPESHRQAHPHWSPGMTAASVVLWADLDNFRGTMRLTPVAE